jgi:hypothetical protein
VERVAIPKASIPQDGTVVKTFRIPEAVYAKLQTEAKARGLTTNALVSLVFTKFVNWDRLTSRFEFIEISKGLFRSILDLMGARELEEAAGTGSRFRREAYMFWFGDITIESYLRFLSYTCTFGRHAEFECQANERDYTITLRHDLGLKWSNWLRFSHRMTLKDLFNIDAQFEVSDTAVIIRFHIPVASGQAKGANH